MERRKINNLLLVLIIAALTMARLIGLEMLKHSLRRPQGVGEWVSAHLQPSAV